MIDQRPNDTADLDTDLDTGIDATDIDRAPSPADVAASDERVGRVDFTRRLGHRRPRGLRDDRDRPGLADVPGFAEVGEEDEERGDDPRLVILPPARVEEILAAEEAKLQAEAGATPGRPAPTTQPGRPAQPPQPAQPPRSVTAPELAPDRTPDLDVGQSVEDVAATIIASMRTIEENHHRHLEALEAEATRRYELLLAQAELDAELIRLNGRREAHRIIADARLRTGAPRGDQPAESTRLQEIGETFTRFAETIENATAAPPPDHGTT